jgi:hypothetical protein
MSPCSPDQLLNGAFPAALVCDDDDDGDGDGVV